jgi:hypothetical protein
MVRGEDEEGMSESVKECRKAYGKALATDTSKVFIRIGNPVTLPTMNIVHPNKTARTVNGLRFLSFIASFLRIGSPPLGFEGLLVPLPVWPPNVLSEVLET